MQLDGLFFDSPPEKDVQWPTRVSSNKFLQKIWNLNQLILKMKQTELAKRKLKILKIKLIFMFIKLTKRLTIFI